MLSEDKITEIFCIADDFCKEFEVVMEKMSLKADGKKHRNRKTRMSEAEIMTILICFLFGSFRNFKHYYLFYVKVHLTQVPRTCCMTLRWETSTTDGPSRSGGSSA